MSTQPYNVGDAVADWLGFFFPPNQPNLCYPIIWLEALDILLELTAQLEGANTARGAPEDQLTRDLRRWSVRVTEYSMVTAAVPIEQQYDREPVLWDVTAPLLLGWYGGPDGTNVLPPGGFFAGFDAKLQHPPDIATPYSLANQLKVGRDFEEWAARQIRRDMQATVIGIGRGAAGAAGNVLEAVGNAAGSVISTALGTVPWWVWGIGLGAGYLWLTKPAAVIAAAPAAV